jgi:hypothetical protein
MLHAMRVDWPCLSLAILPDKLGQQRYRAVLFCETSRLIAADSATKNQRLNAKLNNAHHIIDDDFLIQYMQLQVHKRIKQSKTKSYY